MKLAVLPLGFFVCFVLNVLLVSFDMLERTILSFIFSYIYSLFNRFFEIFSYRHLKKNNNFFLFWWSLRNELEKVNVKRYTKNDQPDLHIKSSISVSEFLNPILWTIIWPQQIFCGLMLIRTTIHYNWMHRLSLAVST